MNNPISLHSYLNADLMSVQTEISSRKKLLQDMAHLLAMPLADTREKEIYHLLLEREKLGNTGIGNGIALPHSRCAHTSEAIIAIITLSEPIDYESLDREPVDIAFGLLVPEAATQEHLGLLAAIARLMSVETNRQELLEAHEADEIIELIKNWVHEEASA